MIDLDKLEELLHSEPQQAASFRELMCNLLAELHGEFQRDISYRGNHFDFRVRWEGKSDSQVAYGNIPFFLSPGKISLGAYLESRFRNRRPPPRYIVVLPFVRIPELERHLQATYAKKYPGKELILLPLEKVFEGVNRFPRAIYERYRELVDQDVVRIIDSSIASPFSYRDQRSEFMKQLRNEVNRNGIVLFLGAGVSMDMNAPSWNTLLLRMLLTFLNSLHLELNIDEQQQEIYANVLLEMSNQSPLQIARYLNVGLGSHFEETTQKIIYEGVSQQNGPLMDTIVALCKHNKVKAVVTYNFDDLLERALDKEEVAYALRYKEEFTARRDEIPIIHVHGFRPRDRKGYPDLPESFLVFTEANYHKLLENPYHWVNLVQLQYLRNQTCLFIGMSATDPNQRRLLEIARRSSEAPRHFGFMNRVSQDYLRDVFNGQRTDLREAAERDAKRTGLKKKIAADLDSKAKALRKIRARPQDLEAINKIHHGLLNDAYEELGLNILWVDHFSEIPPMVRTLIT